MRVGGSFFGNNCDGAKRTPPPSGIPDSGDRPVTDESRLVTATILLVNAGGRKHWFPVSGVTRRTFRRAATPSWDDRLRGNKAPGFQ
jgi:hypothetical protein